MTLEEESELQRGSRAVSRSEAIEPAAPSRLVAIDRENRSERRSGRVCRTIQRKRIRGDSVG